MKYRLATPSFALALVLVSAAAGYSQSSTKAKEAELKGEAARNKELRRAKEDLEETFRHRPDYPGLKKSHDAFRAQLED